MSTQSKSSQRRKRGISGEIDLAPGNDEVRFSRWGKYNLISTNRPVLLSSSGQPLVPYSSSEPTPVRLDAIRPDHTILQDELLAAASRMDLNGRSVPVLGGILLLSKLGQGGMGAVYYGIHPRLDQEVAVKVFPKWMANHDPSAAHRFIREARLAFSVRSPHLIAVIDVNEENGILYLVMEYVKGQTAADYQRDIALRTAKNLSETIVLDLCIGAARGLEAAHRQGVIHRDVKPDNIMIPYANHAAAPRHMQKPLNFAGTKLLDLGLARKEMRDKSTQRSGFCLGTPGFMAPEQTMDASSVGKPADVFAMGATMFSLLTGKIPSAKRSTRRSPFTKPRPAHRPIRALNPEISDPVAQLIDRCLELQPEKRPPDATALLRALRTARSQIDSSYKGSNSGEWTAL